MYPFWRVLLRKQGEDIYYNTDGQPVDYWILIELPCATELTIGRRGSRTIRPTQRRRKGMTNLTGRTKPFGESQKITACHEKGQPGMVDQTPAPQPDSIHG